MSCISLTTDFGLDDWFVGTMKGVIQTRSPATAVIDLTHGIPRGDIRAGAFALMSGYRHFPKQTVHVAVVDPGVGSNRAAIAIETADYFFVGPDNGTLSWAVRSEQIRAIHQLQNSTHFQKEVSATFHGRDIFAPVAAAIANGTNISELGASMPQINQLQWPEVHRTEAGLIGEVIYVDRFGNGITNIPNTELGKLKEAMVRIDKTEFGPLKEFYNAVEVGQPVAVRGSGGYLELAVNRGSAVASQGLETGATISVTPTAN